MLVQGYGATLNEIRSETGWQAHTVRGFISRMKHAGHEKLRGARIADQNGTHIMRTREQSAAVWAVKSAGK
jgi:Protein of unknown function (DUF3489)